MISHKTFFNNFLELCDWVAHCCCFLLYLVNVFLLLNSNFFFYFVSRKWHSYIHIGCFHTYYILIILQHLSFIVCVCMSMWFLCVFFSPLSLLSLTAVYFYGSSNIQSYFIFYFQKTQQHDTTCKCLFSFVQ